MSHATSRTRWFIGLVAALIVGLAVSVGAASEAEPAMEGLAGGEASWEQAYDEAMLQGRDAYNAEDYQKAAQQFIRAIQIFPRNPAAYRNLARSYNLAGQLDRATAYYDEYLELAPDGDDAEQIREERRGAVARGGDDPWSTPADQRMARRALERELDDGRALTDRGGAWTMYQSLLELDYARPDLERLRSRLEGRLVEEFDEKLEADDGGVPVITDQQWELQQRRLDALEDLARSAEALEEVQTRRAVVQAARALVAGDYERAAQRAEPAAEAFEFAGWYRAVALAEAGRPAEGLEVVDQMLADELFDGPARGRLQVLRASLLAELDRTEEAAEIFETILR